MSKRAYTRWVAEVGREIARQLAMCAGVPRAQVELWEHNLRGQHAAVDG